jgi:hypothetical protein
MAMLLRPPAFLARIAVRLAVAAALSGGPVLAADSGNGSKNFVPPSGVPNYFSNEAGPLAGGAAESRRSESYANPAARAPEARPAAAPAVAAAPAPQARQHIAMAVPHTRSLRGRHAAVVHAAVHGRSVAHAAAHAVAHGGGRGPVEHASARTTHAPVRAAHPAGRTTKAGVAAHHHARG